MTNRVEINRVAAHRGLRVQQETLLDRFAMAALTGLMQGLPQGWGANVEEIASDRCSDAYVFAQAMMKAREAQK